MSIEKKSLISTLKSAKKANVTKEEISFDHGRSAVKAQPVVRLAAKASAKHNLAAKAVAKSSATIKLARKNSTAMKAAMKS